MESFPESVPGSLPKNISSPRQKKSPGDAGEFFSGSDDYLEGVQVRLSIHKFLSGVIVITSVVSKNSYL